MDKKKSTGLLLSILGVLSLVLITAGVTYAFFTYTKQGTTTNTLSTGKLTFIYTDETNGFSIDNAYPMTDEQGMAQTPFTFNIKSDTTTKAKIGYVVTASKVTGSTLAENQVKIRLTAGNMQTGDVNNTNPTRVADTNNTGVLFSELTTNYSGHTANVPANQASMREPVIYTGTVPADQTNFTNGFGLQLWINGEGNTGAEYSPYEFVLKTAVTGNDALDADTLIAATQLITSDTYYGKSADEQALYERIAYVNQSTRKIFTVSQTPASTDGYTAGEQFYELNDLTFKVRVNVYADADTNI